MPKPDLATARRHPGLAVLTLGALGVDVISVGALTHSAKAADIGLDWSIDV